jgi:hypothetical protein
LGRQDRGHGRLAAGSAPLPWPRIARDYGYTFDDLRKLWDGRMRLLRIELFFDHDAGTWHYRVPTLHINGILPARHKAEQHCLSAIALHSKATLPTTTPPPKRSPST